MTPTPLAEKENTQAIDPASCATQEVLHRCAHFRVYRLRSAQGESVLCKELLGPRAVERLRHEKGILERLRGIRGVPRLAGGDFPPGLLILEDAGAPPLLEGAASPPLTGRPLLEFSHCLAETLSAMHGAGVAHKNLTPEKILLCGEDRHPLIVDFALATTFAEERPAFLHHSEIAGTLAYLAPEQTGRTGRSVDQRADLYALGAVLYRVACGRDPFQGDDPLQLIHDILAVPPAPPTGVPEPFGAIIMRLLQKEPDRRYQSAQGVAYDLKRLLGGEMEFTLGERDFPPRLAPLSRLVGRQRELAALSRALEGALEGRGTAVLLCGRAGVGKTALANELRPQVAARRGWFVSGKFEQYRRDPTSAVVQALRALGRLLLAQPEGELERQRERLLSALGADAGLIAASIPEFCAVLGRGPQAMPDDPREAQTRLFAAGRSLLRTVVSPACPLVMFIDDLQWGSEGAVAFLDSLLCDLHLDGFFLVLAYRDDELDGTHPLCAVLPRWQALDAVSLSLPVANLPAEGTAELLEEMLHLKPGEARSLARCVGERTGGNPYDTLEFLNGLRKEGILSLGAEGWQWQESAVRGYLGEGDVLEFIARRLASLPAASGSVLAAIASLGGEVEERVLQHLILSPEDLEVGVQGALEDGVLVLVQGAGGGSVLRFRHDRAQQCVYDRMEPAHRPSLHLALARRLAPLPDMALRCAEQYLGALELLTEGEELRRAALLFWEGAQEARTTANYAMCERFLAAAVRCCDRNVSLWQEPLLARLETSWHSALYSLGRFEEGDGVYRSIERRCSHPMQLAEAACIQINSLTNRGRQTESVRLGLELLQRLGFSPVGAQAQLAEGVERLGRWAWEGSAEEERPEVSDPLLLAAARLLHHLVAPAFFSDPMLCFLVQLEAQRLFMEHGPCESLLIGFAGSPLITTALNDDYSTGCRALQRAIAIGEVRGYTLATSWARHCFALFGSHWVQPLQLGVRQALLAREGLLRAGDLQFACFTYHSTVTALCDSAPQLSTFKEELDLALAFAGRTGNRFSEPVFAGYLQLWRALTGRTACYGSFEDSSFEEGAYLRELAEHPLATAKYHIHRALCAALFGDDEALVRHARAAHPLLPYLQGFYKSAIGHLLHALALARAVPGTAIERGALSEALEAEKRWLKARAAEVPENFLHLLHLVEAEEAWGAGEGERAAVSFDAALLAAEECQRPWHRALITERAALFQHSAGLVRSARKLLVEAHYLYESWGASAKVRQLEESHPFLQKAVQIRRLADGGAQSHSAASLELLAILRASQALSCETSLERLTSRVVELLKASTGATSIVLVLPSEDDREWVAAGAPGSSLPVSEAGGTGILPLSAFRYLQRTLEPLLVEDALHDQRFCRDPHLRGAQQCSLMLVPIVKQGAPCAFLILENRLSSSAFTPESLETVQLIAGQLAVSLENARLYERLEERVAQRTRELKEAQAELVATARHAGMAEIATNVLHNVGNVLNSVNISAGVVLSVLAESKGKGLGRAVALLREHEGGLAEFFGSDPRGGLLPGYLEKLAQALDVERHGLVAEVERLSRSVDHIKEIVTTQQAYAGSCSLVEPVRVAELLEDALRMNEGALSRHQVTVLREIEEIPVVSLDKARLLQVLVNLISNAKYAMDGLAGERRLTLAACVAGGRLRLEVRDEGEGIAPENLTRVFNHGFTTRKGGHGFGLHSCALAAREMGGTLTAASPGRGEGATFTLDLPLHPP